MAKVKTFAVTVVVPVERTYYVDARRPNGAVERLLSEEGFEAANLYRDPYEIGLSDVQHGEITQVREVG